MDLLSLLILLIIIGVVLYLVQLIPMDARVKQAIIVIAIAFVVIWLIRALLGGGPVLSIR
jgi:hypothetical protein